MYKSRTQNHVQEQYFMKNYVWQTFAKSIIPCNSEFILFFSFMESSWILDQASQ